VTARLVDTPWMLSPARRFDVERDGAGIAHVIGLSGGKDSTALALRLRELNPDTPYTFICTATGDELPEMQAHWQLCERLLGRPLRQLGKPGTTLASLRQRWCTRLLKIEPTKAFMLALAASGPAVLYVGLRADEEERQGLFWSGRTAFPLREWGWGVGEVWAYLARRGVTIPRRTDCALCYHQRVIEWKVLREQHPERYAEGVAWEEKTGHTFRSPGRDTWPAGLRELGDALDSGRAVRGEKAYRERVEKGEAPCRVCSL
jgi:3'-phosphoadenosine 5'-phosphosulfate sulfotransferase (PAPS reductase)/FAD synthetase